MRQFEASSSRGFSQGWNNAWINDVTLYGPSALVTWDTKGSLNYMTATYMNSPAVREALHLDKSPNKDWPGPGPKWSYTSDYAACNGNAAPGTKSMVDFYREISPKMLHGATVYNGDTDPCVSYVALMTHRRGIDDSTTSFLYIVTSRTLMAHRWRCAISVLSVRWQATLFMLTCGCTFQ